MPQELFAAHTLIPGHPDLHCDLLADALVDAALRQDPQAHCEVMVTQHGTTLDVAGSLPDGLDVTGLVQKAFPTAAVQLHLAARERGLGGHAIATGYAIDEPGTNDLPAEFWLARQLALRLANLCNGGELIVLVEANEHPARLAGCSLSLQIEAFTASLEREARAMIQDELSHLARRAPGFDSRLPESIALQPFTPLAQAASGRWFAAHAYGPRVGSCDVSCPGKDLAHPARALPLIARRLARAVVRAGVARECRAVMTRVPGQDEATIVALTGDGKHLDPSRWGELVDRSLSRFASRTTGKVNLVEVTHQGQFLREDWPWEQIRFNM